MKILPCGAEAVLVEFADLDEVQFCYTALRDDPPTGVTDLVPAARTLLVGFDPTRTEPAAVRARIRSAVEQRQRLSGTAASDSRLGRLGRLVEVPVRYSGPDLADVARLTGLTEADVIRRHATGGHRVAFCGFAPGFAYIAGLDPALRLPRRAEPRTKVPAGSVAIADEFSGVYPRSSPGGWHLIGVTDLRTFDLNRDPPFAFAPGDRVRFVAA